MKQVAIVSAKGGTGKTTVAACLANLAQPAVVADCDVDAANLGLLLAGDDGPQQVFFAGKKAAMSPERCIGCGTCFDACRFGAISQGAEMTYSVDPLSCEGCGVCHMVCPVEAATLCANQAGVWMVRETATGPLVHARLGVAQDNSGKLVAQVREVARAEASTRGLELVLIDGPPGIGCPLHAAVTGVDLLVAVTEPTPSGAHDLERLLKLAQSFSLRAVVFINKADLSDTHVRQIEQLAREFGSRVVGRLPFEPEIPRLLAQKQIPIRLVRVAEEIRKLWLRIHSLTLSANNVPAQGFV